MVFKKPLFNEMYESWWYLGKRIVQECVEFARENSTGFMYEGVDGYSANIKIWQTLVQQLHRHKIILLSDVFKIS